ncbi:hypothetical protein BDZ97DRAFT_1920357 [Flammula alnicola]|nr:hypothetical protein BDZ97DRAFT_1920357 [Flammula alnicola]
MSFTLTSTSERSATKTPTVYLSPSKRRRLSPPDPHRTTHTAKEIWSWTFKSDAIAMCSILDALEMKENTLENYDFFWLGSVPCRSVKVVGMVVGVQVYDKKILYTEPVSRRRHRCHRLFASAASPKPSPKRETATSKYKMPEKLEPPLSPKPIARVGQVIRTTGRVRMIHDSRQIIVDRIVTCSSPNDELIHARAVRQLHRTSYSRKEPFVIPVAAQHPLPITPTKNVVSHTPSAMRSSPPSSVSSSPVKAESIYSSPIKQPPVKKSPIKLRHPSRVHTHDVTENTFRIYVKHYMDHAPLVRESHESEYDSDIIIANSIAQVPSTPTKSSRSDDTPRQSFRHEFHTTPRPRIPALNFSGNAAGAASFALRPSTSQVAETRQGFSLSYLRRVPELSLLASRVVHAVNRRRLRDERKKMKEAGVISSRSQKPTDSSLTIPPDKLAPKMKRLFQWAIVQLLKEGCIVLWDGPVRACPDTSIMNASRLWKSNTTASTFGGDSTLFGTTSGSIPPTFTEENDDDGGTLSDPDPDEEAYIALTPEYLADFVEKAIKLLVDHYEEIGKPYTGATKDGVLSVLRRDDRWKYVGAWNIDDALEYLKLEGRVWSMGNGGWDLTA